MRGAEPFSYSYYRWIPWRIAPHQFELLMTTDATRILASLHGRVEDFMHRDFAALQPDVTVGDALKALRGQVLNSPIVYLYAVDEDRVLQGVVPVRRLLMAEEQATIKDLMVRNVVTVQQGTSMMDASEMFLQHRYLALPVVDDDIRILGVIDIHVFSAERPEPHEREALDSLFQLIGVHVRLGRRVPPWVSFSDRFPWLLANIGSGVVCALIAGLYEATIAAVTLIALFLTVVLALAESVSMQSMTLTMQGLVGTPKINARQLIRQLGQEMATAIMLGLGCGGLVGLVVLIWKHDGVAAVAVGGSIMFSMLLACILGILVPTSIRAFRADPRIASGPITLAATDILTLLIYFNVSMWLLT